MFNELLEDKYEMSLGKIMLLFYLFSSSSYLKPLLSKQWKTQLENNRMAQHILGITTILALTMLVSNGQYSTPRIIAYTIVGYLWFLLSTKLDLQWNIMVMILLVSYILYQNTITQKEKHIQSDKNLSDEEKDILYKKDKKNYMNMFIIIILITMGGTLLYSTKKEGQYGGGYSLTNFLLY